MSKTSKVDAHQWLDQRHSEPQLVDLQLGRAAVFSRRSPSKETPNEDGALLISVAGEQAVLAVADGCGGMRGGDQAARLTLNALTEIVQQRLAEGMELRPAILDAIETANSKVVALGTGAAATLAVAEIRDKNVRPYHVGDAQILLVGNRGKIKLQTSSHSPVGYAVEAGMLSEEEAIRHEERHIVSNVVGSMDGHIEIGSWRTMALRDTLLIASDGVFDNLHLDEIVEMIRKGPLKKAASRLAAETLTRMQATDTLQPSKPDDTTFVLFRQVG